VIEDRDQLRDDDILTVVQMALRQGETVGSGDQKCSAEVLAPAIDLTDEYVNVQAQRPQVIVGVPMGQGRLPHPRRPVEVDEASHARKLDHRLCSCWQEAGAGQRGSWLSHEGILDSLP
jgi:hypothetical protein